MRVDPNLEPPMIGRFPPFPTFRLFRDFYDPCPLEVPLQKR